LILVDAEYLQMTNEVSNQVQSLLTELKAQEKQIQSNEGLSLSNSLEPTISGNAGAMIQSDSVTQKGLSLDQSTSLPPIDSRVSNLLSRISPSTLQQLIQQSGQHPVDSVESHPEDTHHDEDPRTAVFSILNGSPHIVMRLIQVTSRTQ
jgi:hypothetical protein